MCRIIQLDSEDGPEYGICDHEINVFRGNLVEVLPAVGRASRNREQIRNPDLEEDPIFAPQHPG